MTKQLLSMKPADIAVGANPLVPALINTLGKAELEFTAAMIIRYHHVRGLTEWTPVSRADLQTLLQGDAADPVLVGWARNPFWRPAPFEFAQLGYIEGWTSDPADKGMLTPKFFEAVEAEQARRRALAKRQTEAR